MKLAKAILRTTLGIAALLLPGIVAAQMAPPASTPPPGHGGPFGMHGHGPDLGKWWKNSDVVRELGLSSTQISQIEQKFLEHRLKLIDLHADLEKQETMLQPLIEAEQPDEAKVGAQIDQVMAARGRLEKANAMMMLSIRRVLTVEQWKKLQMIQASREMWHRPGGAHAPRPEQPPQPPRPPEDEL